MYQIFKPISISLSPNTEWDDVWLAWKLIFQPRKWKQGKAAATEELENEFKQFNGAKYVFGFNGGRSALLAILKSLDLEPESEVLLQAFTCNAAVNPVLWAGLKPVYVDCDENDFNIDIEDLKRKITPKSKVVMVQHTFGLPVDMDKILEICKQNNLILIEDCAHSLGAEFRGQRVGTFGKAAFFSFSRDKVISSVYGGIALTNDDNLAGKIRAFQEEIGYPSGFWISQQLLHPILMNCLILPTYSILGKYLLILFQWLHILSKAVHWKEKRGKKPDYFPKRMPDALAVLALNQFRKLERFNIHRKELSSFYYNELKELSSFGGFFQLPPNPPDREQIFLRFTIKHTKAQEIIKKAWQKNLLIGDWYTNPIAPSDTKLEEMKYKLGTCPKAEKLARVTLNLPTHINIFLKEAKKIVDFLKKYGD